MLIDTKFNHSIHRSIRMIRAYEQGKQSLSKAEAGTVFRLATVLGCEARSLVE